MEPQDRMGGRQELVRTTILPSNIDIVKGAADKHWVSRRRDHGGSDGVEMGRFQVYTFEQKLECATHG